MSTEEQQADESGALRLFEGYEDFLRDLKARIRTAQVRAALAVNHELVMLYWHIGGEISRRMWEHGWGAKVVDRLSADLRREFPDMQGFSPRNLRYMRSFAEAWPDEAILQEALARISRILLLFAVVMIAYPPILRYFSLARRTFQ